MTLGISVLMNTGIVLVADTRVSRGYHIVHDNAKKIVQLDDFTAVIHSGKNVNGWQEDLKSWHCICRESSGNDWLRYIGCLQAQMGNHYRTELSSEEQMELVMVRWDGWLGPMGAKVRVSFNEVGSNILYRRDANDILIIYTGEIGILTSHFVVPEFFKGIGSLEEAIEQARWLIHRVSEIQEYKGLPRTVGRKTTISIITPDGYRELQEQG